MATQRVVKTGSRKATPSKASAASRKPRTGKAATARKPASKAVTGKKAAKRTASTAPAKKAVRKVVGKAAPKRAATSATKKVAAKHGSARKPAVNKNAKKTVVGRSGVASKRTVVAARKSAAPKTAAKNAVVKKAVIKKAAVKKAPVKKTDVRKTAVFKAPVKQPVARQAAVKPVAAGKPAAGRTGDVVAAKTTPPSAPKAARSTRAPRKITPEQALANTRKLLQAKQAHDRQVQPWQTLDPEHAHVPQSGFQSPEAAQKAEELHEAESRMKAIQGSIGSQDRQAQGKRDGR